jgi:hypothetical protein
MDLCRLFKKFPRQTQTAIVADKKKARTGGPSSSSASESGEETPAAPSSVLTNTSKRKNAE